MNRYLKQGQLIRIPEKTGCYRIEKIAGSSPLGVVYKTLYFYETGKTSIHFLQEYNPKYVGVKRKLDNCLLGISEKENKKFMLGLQDFMQSYNFQKNECCNAYGNWYVDICGFPEICYEEIEERNLGSFLQRMEMVTEELGKFHKEGYLHLNVRPDNIYISEENPEEVYLLDFGSVIGKEELLRDKPLFSYEKEWAAPELRAGRRKDICEATDLFSVGEMIFCMLKGRHSYPEERRSFSAYEFDYNADILADAKKKTFSGLREILSKTICNVPEKRYQSAAELKDALKVVRRELCGI